MSYADIKPQYYRMHQPDSPWHAGSPGWSTAPWPSFNPNPNLVGPPRLAVEGLGAYFKPEYEKPISGMGEYFASGTAGLGAYFKPEYEKPISGLGAFPQKSIYRPRPSNGLGGGCGCQGTRGFGDAVDNAVMTPTVPATNKTNAALLIGLGVAVIIGGVIFLGPHHG